MQGVSQKNKTLHSIVYFLIAVLEDTQRENNCCLPYRLHFLTRRKPHRGEVAGSTYCSIRAIHTSPSDDCKSPQAISPVGHVWRQPPVSLVLHTTRGFGNFYTGSPAIPLQVDDQQFRGEAGEDKDLSYNTRLIWAHIEWGRRGNQEEGENTATAGGTTFSSEVIWSNHNRAQ